MAPDAPGENDMSQKHHGSRREDSIDRRIITMLHDQRPAVREKGLEALASSLETCCSIGMFDYRCATVLERCRACLGSSATEARLAYRAIGLLALTVGSSDDCAREILRDALPGLVETVEARAPLSTSSSSEDDVATAVSAIDCLAAVTFACSRVPNQAFTNAIRGVIKLGTTANSDVLVAAVSALALIRATSRYRASFPLRGLVRLLDTKDVALLIAVGEALAVWSERDMKASPQDMQALEYKLAIVAAEARGEGVDKKKHAKKTKLFQEIAAMIAARRHYKGGRVEKPMPTSSFSPSCVLRASGWARMVQLKFLKRYLGNGFYTHTFFNPLIEEEYWSTDSDDDDDNDGSCFNSDSADGNDDTTSSEHKDCVPNSHSDVEDGFVMVHDEVGDFVMV